MCTYIHIYSLLIYNSIQHLGCGEYLTDAEVWLMTDSLRQLKALQLDIVSLDIQELIMDVNYTRLLLRDLAPLLPTRGQTMAT